ncbi:CoA-binding protein [Candidatus Woesearchaeota archaeon]|nr:CoA-binding protein [Candidatus Woesearchaeota archaeon]
MNLEPFFKARTIAVIGASRESGKIGNVILKQLMGRAFTPYPVNPSAESILGLRCYPVVTDITGSVELAVIATPAATIPAVLDQCGKKGIHHVVIISAGFKEIGNTKLEKQLQDKLKANNIHCIGPNCLGVFDAHTKLDMLFLPHEKLKRPKPGVISFISQSGATGSAILDLAAHEGYGFAKFISYGNAANVDESDLLEYLANDPDTKVICMYVEGITQGRKFIDIAKRCKKPIIAVKGGTTTVGSRAAQSHTGSLAGSAEVYFGAFAQAGVIRAKTLQELFEYVTIFEKSRVRAAGNRVHIVTNGGGYGILTADAVEHEGLQLAKPGKNLSQLRKNFPPTVVLHNPTDLLGDATDERYQLVLDAIIKDSENDAIIVIALPQTPLLDENLIHVLAAAYKKSHKPIVLVTTGSETAQNLKRKAEAAGIPAYDFPENAVRALAAYTKYCSNC